MLVTYIIFPHAEEAQRLEAVNFLPSDQLMVKKNIEMRNNGLCYSRKHLKFE